MTQEKIITPTNGYLMLFASLALLFGGIAGIFITKSAWFVFLIVLFIFMSVGFVMVQPNGSRVLLLFGKYIGTIKKNGFIG